MIKYYYKLYYFVRFIDKNQNKMNLGLIGSILVAANFIGILPPWRIQVLLVVIVKKKDGLYWKGSIGMLFYQTTTMTMNYLVRNWVKKIYETYHRLGYVLIRATAGKFRLPILNCWKLQNYYCRTVPYPISIWIMTT